MQEPDRMSTYTFIFEFRGGVYLSQVDAADPVYAKDKWARELDVSAISGMGQKTKSAIVKSVAADTPTPIQGMEGVWCLDGVAFGHFFLVHFVQGG